jgi:uncharacterized protein YegL
MKKDLTELVFILDKSGSMGGLEADTIGGYNSMLKKQKAIKGECFITTVLFDDGYELLHDRIDIKAVNKISDKDYFVGGSTALLDAIGKTIYKIGNAQKHTDATYRAQKVMFVIITDGQENASQLYCAQKVKKMIEKQKAQYGWEFVFLGANIDAVQTARDFGIDADRAQNYHADSKGIGIQFCEIGEAVSSMRKAGIIEKKWGNKIEEDYKKRKAGDRK